jgi:hypothetical protein
MKSRTQRRGRPRKPETTELMKALIARQDSLSKRSARQIRILLERYVPREVIVEAEAAFTAHLRKRCAQAAKELTAPVTAATTSGDVFRIMDTYIREMLTEIADDESWHPRPRPRRVIPALVPPPTHLWTSRSLAAARARAARLGSQLRDLRGLIDPRGRQ